MFGIWTAKRGLRRLGPGDAAAWAALRALVLAAHPEAQGDSHDDRAGWRAADFRAHMARAEVWGVVRAGVLVACLTIERDATVARLSEVCVRPGHRGRGHARALLVHAARRARGHGLTRLSLEVAEENLPACRAYRAAGFRDEGSAGRGLAANGRLLTRRRMVRDLSA